MNQQFPYACPSHNITQQGRALYEWARSRLSHPKAVVFKPWAFPIGAATGCCLVDVVPAAPPGDQDQIFASDEQFQYILRRGLTFADDCPDPLPTCIHTVASDSPISTERSLVVGPKMEGELNEPLIVRRGFPKFFEADPLLLKGVQTAPEVSSAFSTKLPIILATNQLRSRLCEEGTYSIYRVDKLNGGNAQISYFSKLGCWVCCSKNVSLLARSISDLEDEKIKCESKFAFAKLIAAAWFEFYNDLTPSQKSFLQEVLSSRTLIGELIGSSAFQHLVDYGERSRIVFYGCVPHSGEELSWFPQQLKEKLADTLDCKSFLIAESQLVGSSLDSEGTFNTIARQIEMIREESLARAGEGAVLYIVEESDEGREFSRLVGLVKCKTNEYRLLRKVRSKCVDYAKTRGGSRSSATVIQSFRKQCSNFTKFQLVNKYVTLLAQCLNFIDKSDLPPSFIDYRTLEFFKLQNVQPGFSSSITPRPVIAIYFLFPPFVITPDLHYAIADLAGLRGEEQRREPLSSTFSMASNEIVVSVFHNSVIFKQRLFDCAELYASHRIGVIWGYNDIGFEACLGPKWREKINSDISKDCAKYPSHFVWLPTCQTLQSITMKDLVSQKDDEVDPLSDLKEERNLANEEAIKFEAMGLKRRRLLTSFWINSIQKLEISENATIKVIKNEAAPARCKRELEENATWKEIKKNLNDVLKTNDYSVSGRTREIKLPLPRYLPPLLPVLKSSVSRQQSIPPPPSEMTSLLKVTLLFPMGIPGSGKTTLFQEFLKKWCEKSDFIDNSKDRPAQILIKKDFKLFDLPGFLSLKNNSPFDLIYKMSADNYTMKALYSKEGDVNLETLPEESFHRAQRSGKRDALTDIEIFFEKINKAIVKPENLNILLIIDKNHPPESGVESTLRFFRSLCTNLKKNKNSVLRSRAVAVVLPMPDAEEEKYPWKLPTLAYLFQRALSRENHLILGNNRQSVNVCLSFYGQFKDWFTHEKDRLANVPKSQLFFLSEKGSGDHYFPNGYWFASACSSSNMVSENGATTTPDPSNSHSASFPLEKTVELIDEALKRDFSPFRPNTQNAQIYDEIGKICSSRPPIDLEDLSKIIRPDCDSLSEFLDLKSEPLYSKINLDHISTSLEFFIESQTNYYSWLFKTSLKRPPATPHVTLHYFGRALSNPKDSLYFCRAGTAEKAKKRLTFVWSHTVFVQDTAIVAKLIPCPSEKDQLPPPSTNLCEKNYIPHITLAISQDYYPVVSNTILKLLTEADPQVFESNLTPAKPIPAEWTIERGKSRCVRIELPPSSRSTDSKRSGAICAIEELNPPRLIEGPVEIVYL